MLRRAISLIILAAFLNCILGCTKTTKISMHETNPAPEVKIAKVILKSGEEIKFDEDGAILDPRKQIVIGYVEGASLHGQLIELKFEDIEEIQETNPIPEGKIAKVVLKSGEEIKFDEDGAWLDTKKQLVQGYIEDESLYGQLIEVKMADIEEIHFKKADESSAFLLVGGIVIGVLIVVIGAGLIIGGMSSAMSSND